MKKYFFSFIILLFCTALYSQTIKIENGITCSSMHAEYFDMLNENTLDYSFVAGFDYFDHKLFYLSSEIGYMTKGGKETNLIGQEGVTEIQETWQYIHLNTTVRFKYQIDQSHLFIGIGPKLDALVGSNRFEDVFYSNDFKMNKFSFGCKAELGVAQDFNRFRMGVNYSYLVNFGEVGKSPYRKVYNNTQSIRFSIGYRLK